MKTYSNRNGKQEDQLTNNMRKLAIKNSLSQKEKDELQRQMGLAQLVNIQMHSVMREGVI